MFRFTIRDLLWLMVVVAVSVGWWVSLSRCKERADTFHDAFYETVEKMIAQGREIERLEALIEKTKSQSDGR